jgi:transporter family protein
MSYLLWAVLALVAYTLVAPLVNVAMTDIPSEVVVFISNSLLVVAAAGVMLSSNHGLSEWLTHPKAPYAYAAGIALAVGIIAYYRALSLGPVSIVVPIFGMFIVTSSILGVAFLDESLTARKVLGLLFAAAAVYLTAVE